MNFAAAHQGHDPVAGLFQAQALLHDRLMVTCHRDGVGIAKEIRRMQHIHVERVALNPFSAVEQTSQQPHGRINFNAESTLDGVYSTHLIRNGADSANAGHKIGDFGEVPAPQQSLEETRRFVDLQFDVLNLIALELVRIGG